MELVKRRSVINSGTPISFYSLIIDENVNPLYLGKEMSQNNN